jgi:hypothetical protein
MPYGPKTNRCQTERAASEPVILDHEISKIISVMPGRVCDREMQSEGAGDNVTRAETDPHGIVLY